MAGAGMNDIKSRIKKSHSVEWVLSIEGRYMYYTAYQYKCKPLHYKKDVKFI